MRTTLSLDDDVLAAAKAIADRDRSSVGAVISQLARKALQDRDEPGAVRNGFPLLPSRGKPGSVTLELVNRLRDEMP